MTGVKTERAFGTSDLVSMGLRWLSVAAVIVAATLLGSWLTFSNGKVCLWPASGIAIALLYRGEARERPGILVLVFLATVFASYQFGDASLKKMFGLGVASVVEAMLAVFLMKRLSGWLIDTSGLVVPVAPTVKMGKKKHGEYRPPTLGTWQNVAAFVLGPCLIATAIAAVIRTDASGPSQLFWVAECLDWWTSAGIGVLIFGSASFVVTEAWRQSPITDIGRPAIWTLLIGQVGLTIYIFAFQTLPIVYTVIPLFILLALFGQPIDGVIGLIVLTLIATWCTTQGWGPFSESEIVSIASGLLQIYLGVCGVSVLAFTAFVRHKEFQQANSQFQLQTIVDSLNAQVFLKDTKNHILRANRVAASALGLDPEDIAGHHASEFFPTLHEKFAADDARILASGQATAGMIEHLPMADGSVCVVETRKSPFRDEHGNIAGIVTVLNDITALKRAESELSALGQLIEESSTESFLFSTESLRFVRANKKAIENLGYTEEELFAMTPLDIKPEHTAETFAKIVQPLQHSMDATVQFDTKHQRKDGTTYDANIVLQRMSYRDSDVYVAFVLDVSDRIRSAEMVENLFSLSPVAQLLFDQRGVIECNEATLKLLGLTNKDDLIGRQPGEFSPEFQPCGTRSDIKAQPIIEHAYRTGFHRFEWSHVRADGTEFVTDVMMRLVRVESGDALLVIWNDITDRKNYETQLVATQKRLESINEELAQFAYIASHDLKAPLRGISNLADFVMEDCADLLPDESVDHLQKMKGRIKRMGKLLDDLLAYSRVGRSHGAMSEESIKDLANRAIQDSAVPETIKVTVDADDLVITTLEAPLQVCLRNLIANAIKHRKEPHGMLRLTATDAIENVEFRIMDDGYGIPPQHFARIFRMFETLRPRDEVEGSGMGLAFVKKTVDTYGGSIQLQSPNEFGGTTFILSWPKRIRV